MDPRRLVVDGVSRGSEAALLLGLRYPKLIGGVVALVPGNVPNVPQKSVETDGVEPLANARARIDAWPKLLRFLDRTGR